MSKTIRNQPTQDKPKSKYKRDRDSTRTMLRSTMNTDTTDEVEQFSVLARQLSTEERDLGSYSF
jgi:uncharacterized protein (DUF2267 family)